MLNMVWDKELASEEFLGIFGLCYIPLGLAFTFSVFREFGHSNTDQLYLALPVSIPERLVSKWFSTTVLYTIAFSLVAIVVGVFAVTVGIILFGVDFSFSAIFSEKYWTIVGTYFIIQPIFMVGAITFSKNKIGKTILSIGILFLGFFLFNLVLFVLFNQGLGVFSNDGLGSVAFDRASSDFSLIGRWFYGILFGPLLLVVAYFKMVEKEV
ncbi:hypothetical protein DX873_03480 [Flagellimonas nanhaiensis]|uniref:Uncharacterized protein n=2 Tax=Flagellimonas nanhaiensis TaxID=2292706 RepID=A0A371JTU9_9FLAO|nr:hypothetical protein DX873_03480 [Allomuricauda nanhaiensis]